MNLSSPVKICQYFCSEVEKNIKSIATDEYEGKMQGYLLEDHKLTPQEVELIKSQIPIELLHPLQPVRGNPSPISPLQIPIYCHGSYYVAHFILSQRHPEIYARYTGDSVTLHDFIDNPSKPIVLSTDAPITSMILFAMIQQILQHYGHGFIKDYHRADGFRRMVREHLFQSKYWESNNVDDHHSLYALFLEVLYWHDYADYAGTFGDELDAFPLQCEMSEIFYNPRHPQYNGLGPRLDALDLNWRIDPTLDAHWHSENTDKSLSALIAIIERSLSSP